jgi:hypothetical protein
MKHYIYILSNPATDEIFYVGCTSQPKQRAYQHRYKLTKRAFEYKYATPKDAYIMSMQADPVFHVIEEVIGFAEVALIRESFWITFLLSKGYPLVNQKGCDLEIVLKSELYGLPKNFNPTQIKGLDCSTELEESKAA